MTIEKDHGHSLRPINVQDLPDGRRIIRSRCQGGCGLEEQQTTYEGRVINLRYRFGGLWFEGLDLVRLGQSLDLIECEVCGGEEGFAHCENCGDAGVTTRAGEMVETPEFRQV